MREICQSVPHTAEVGKFRSQWLVSLLRAPFYEMPGLSAGSSPVDEPFGEYIMIKIPCTVKNYGVRKYTRGVDLILCGVYIGRVVRYKHHWCTFLHHSLCSVYLR